MKSTPPTRLCHFALWTAVLLFWAHLTAAGTLEGEVVRIADGDTLTLLTADHSQHRIRLADIDTPERRQPWGKRARQALAGKVFRKHVRVEASKKDRYGRWIGRVHLGQRDINAEMVEEGHAWVYRRYSRDPHLLDLEAQARKEKRGLWGLQKDQRMPPWYARSTPLVKGFVPSPSHAQELGISH